MFKEFEKDITPLFKNFNKPVLLLHADHHHWKVEKNHLLPNITKVQVDKITPEFPFVQIAINPNNPAVFEFNRRLEEEIWFNTIKK